MQVVADIAAVRRARHADPSATWGLVPTMGALHEGHLSLVRQARRDNARVGVSIFVNPAQFHNPDDLATYPRDPERDLAMLKQEGVDLVWTPSPDQVYPAGYQTYVHVEEASRPLEGAARPGHFRGVATVCAKLMNVFEPQRVYFGQKDAQQVAVIRRMVEDLNFPLTVVSCPTVREPGRPRHELAQRPVVAASAPARHLPVSRLAGRQAMPSHRESAGRRRCALPCSSEI